MLVACRLAGLSALEAYYAGVRRARGTGAAGKGGRSGLWNTQGFSTLTGHCGQTAGIPGFAGERHVRRADRAKAKADVLRVRAGG